jgi:hypothetical protein
MSFSRARLPGFWTFGSAVSPGEFEHIDDYAYAIDGQNGGAYAPSAVITIGGDGLTVTGEFNASDMNIVDVSGSLTINSGATLQLTGNQVVNSGAVVGFTSGSFLTVQSGATFTTNSGSTAAINGSLTVGGAAQFTSTFALVSSNSISISPGRSYTRTCGPAIRYDSSIWTAPTSLASAPVTMVQGAAASPAVYAEMLEFRADVPHSSTLFSVVVRVKGQAALGGLPATLPTVYVIRADTTTGLSSILGSTTDPTTTLADYKLDHDITVSIALPVDRTKYEYLVYVTGDSGSAGVYGTEVSSPRMTFIRGIIGEG